MKQNEPPREQKQELLNDSTSEATVLTVAEESSVSTPVEEKASQESQGAFGPSQQGEEQLITMENGRIRVTLSTLGGSVKRAELLEYKASGDSVQPLRLFGPEEVAFGFTLRTKQSGDIVTSGLYFEPVSVDSNKVTLRLLTSDSIAWMDFQYELSDNYMLSF